MNNEETSNSERFDSIPSRVVRNNISASNTPVGHISSSSIYDNDRRAWFDKHYPGGQRDARNAKRQYRYRIAAIVTSSGGFGAGVAYCIMRLFGH